MALRIQCEDRILKKKRNCFENGLKILFSLFGNRGDIASQMSVRGTMIRSPLSYLITAWLRLSSRSIKNGCIRSLQVVDFDWQLPISIWANV